MDTIQERVDGCSVVFSWTAPYNNGSPITNYNLEVRGSDGSFYTLQNYCGEAGKLHCKVPMSALVPAPFNLDQDDPILVRGQA